MTLYETKEVATPGESYEVRVGQYDLAQALEKQGLKSNSDSLITITGINQNLPRESSDHCILATFVAFLIPCWQDQAFISEFLITAPIKGANREEKVSTKLKATQVFFLPLLFVAPFVDSSNPRIGGLGPASLNASTDIRAAVQRLQKKVDEEKQEITARKQNRARYPIFINNFHYFYDRPGGSSKSVDLDFYNNTGKSITGITITFAPSPTLLSFPPVKPVGPFAYDKRTVKMDVPPGEFATTRRYRNVGSSSQVRAVFLEALTITFSDGTIRNYNSAQVKNMLHEAPRQLFK